FPMREQGDRAPVGSTVTHRCPRPGKEVTSPVPPRDSADCNVAASKQSASNGGGRRGRAPCRIARQTSMMPRCSAPFLISRRRGALRGSLQSACRNPNGGSDKDGYNSSHAAADFGYYYLFLLYVINLDSIH